MPEESYHRAALIAHLTNLNDIEAFEYNNYIRQYPHFLNPKTGMVVIVNGEKWEKSISRSTVGTRL